MSESGNVGRNIPVCVDARLLPHHDTLLTSSPRHQAMYNRCLEPGGPVPVTPDWVTSSAAEGALAEAAAFHPRLLVPPAPATPPPPPDPALAAITGFGEEEDRKPSGEQEKQQQLALLKQNLPWNQPEKVGTAR